MLYPAYSPICVFPHRLSQSISLLAWLKESKKVKEPSLVLVPKSVLGNWGRELAKFAPSLKVLKLQAVDKEERIRMVRVEATG